MKVRLKCTITVVVEGARHVIEPTRDVDIPTVAAGMWLGGSIWNGEGSESIYFPIEYLEYDGETLFAVIEPKTDDIFSEYNLDDPDDESLFEHHYLMWDYALPND